MSNLQLKNATLITPAVFEPGGKQSTPRRPAWRPWLWLVAALLVILFAVAGFLLSATSLDIQVSPASSQIRLAGPYHVQVAGRRLLMPGQYSLHISQPGYSPYERQLDTATDDHFRLNIQLSPLPGRLKATSNVTAQAYLDDLPLGDTDGILTNLPLGKQQIRFEAPRYQSHTEIIEIKGYDELQHLDINLLPNWGTLVLDSYPSGASLSIDEQAFSQTPLNIELLAGTHKLQLSYPGYQNWQQRVEINAGENLTISQARLLPASARLKLTSQPNGASVSVDGLYQGKTPLELSLSAGTNHELLLLREGYQPTRRDIQASAGSVQALNLPLAPLLGKVSVSTQHQDALLYINDILLGRANQTLELATHPQTLRVSLSGYADFIQTLTPKAGQTIKVQANLKTLEQARFEALPAQLTLLGDARLKLFHPQVSFEMGASRREQGRRANETLHKVALARPFYLGMTEVTNRQYRQFASFHSSSHAEGASLDGDNQPVVNIGWLDAARFCNWLSSQEGLQPFYLIEENQYQGFNASANGYRLPSEAEWAWASRYQSKRMQQFNWGQQLPPPAGSVNLAGLESVALVGDILAGYQDSFKVSAPVASFQADQKGLYDLMGNVSEWVHDVYQIHSGLNFKANTDPLGAQQGIHHVIRGASWAHGRLTEVRLSYRDYGNDARRDVGFRLARYAESLPPITKESP
ncbi:PEGA domain-containing protein [Bowmanella pacifica]|uniref:PEGA domain-containing protein n=1 Tax=Bowmanella pacifica TaxID=502051 RepID=A0A918DP43_9ALTE|nr:PEGA domain-containing protein [Bowmanella pacifica]GGO74968.1 hypothetical protein GCM10010982_39040 [Bowmanella pacifica]